MCVGVNVSGRVTECRPQPRYDSTDKHAAYYTQCLASLIITIYYEHMYDVYVGATTQSGLRLMTHTVSLCLCLSITYLSLVANTFISTDAGMWHPWPAMLDPNRRL